MTEPKTLKEKIAKLPAWARDYIETLERERSVAVRELTEFLDKQTPSPFFVEESVGNDIGELRLFLDRIYMQGHAINIEAHGVRLRVAVKYGSTNDDSISLQWEETGHLGRDVAFVPHSYQQARLISKENMR